MVGGVAEKPDLHIIATLPLLQHILDYFCSLKQFSMKRTTYNILITLFMAGIFAGPLKAQLPHLIYHAELSGGEQIPAVATNGKGLITIMYNPDRTKVTVTGLLVDLQGEATAVKLHIGYFGEVGAFLVDLTPAMQGNRLNGEVAVPSALLKNLLPDRTYVTVSTTAHPTGEIRGQFICETDLEYGCILTANEVVPTSNATSFGFGGLHFPTGSRDLVYAFLFSGLSSPVTEFGIYEGGPGQNGPLVHLLPGLAGGFQGLLYLDDLPADFLRLAREGKYHIAIKTENFPDGELRGQMNFLGYLSAFASAYGTQQVPPVSTPAFGFSHNVLNSTLDTMTTTFFADGLTATSVDIHIGEPGMIGPLFQTLNTTATPGLFQKTFRLDSAHMTAFAEGRLYLNVTTATHPNGEIRGKIKNSLRKGYAFDLCSAQMVPPTNSPAFGVGMASVDQVNCYLNYKIIFDRLSGPPAEVFLCQAFPTMNGNALYPMPPATPIVRGVQEIMSSHGVAIELGETYVLLVTEDYPNGEIRGQMVRGFSCPAESGVSIVENVSQVTVSPVPFNGELTVAFDSKAPFDGQIVLYDILGVPALTYPVKIVAGSQTVSISTYRLPAGYYSLILEAPGQGRSLLLKKLIHQ